MEKEVIIEKIVRLLRSDDLLFKSVVGYVNAARKDCLMDKEDRSMAVKYKKRLE